MGINHNSKRSSKITLAKKINLKIIAQLKAETKQMKLSNEHMLHLARLKKKSKEMFQLRQKVSRRKYIKLVEDNKPTAFDKSNKEFNTRLLAVLLPSPFNLRIYDRFSILHQESPLNLKNSDYTEDLEEVLDIKENEETEPIGNHEFFVINPAFVFHAPDKTEAIPTAQALGELAIMTKSMYTNK